ncbi:MAG: hypothetical protein ACOYNK_01860 [Microbacteriaceae bacterium]
MATLKNGNDNSAAEPNSDTPSAPSALMKYRKPLTIAAIVAGGALALGAAFTGGIAVAQHERPHFGNEAMGAPQGGERGERGEREQHRERGEYREREQHRERGEQAERGEQRPGGPGEQRHMGGQPGDSNTPAPTPTP